MIAVVKEMRLYCTHVYQAKLIESFSKFLR